MINAIGTYVGSFKRTFDGNSVTDLPNITQFLNTTPSGTVWPDTTGDYTAPTNHQWEGGAYDFDGVDDYLSCPHLTGSETVTSNDGTSVPTISAGRIDFTAGTCWNLVLSDGSHYKMDETTGTTAFDSSGNGNHGTIMNATLSTFHTTQNTYSFANTVGYTDSSGVRIPRNESNPTQDVLGNPLQYSGRVKYDAQLVESHCATFDGVDDYTLVKQSGLGVFDLQNFTIKAKGTFSSASNAVIWSYDFIGHTSPYYAQHLRFSGSRVFLYWNNGTILQNVLALHGLTEGESFEIEAHFESGSQYIKINGVTIANSSYVSVITYYNQKVWVGRANFGGYYNNKLYDIKFINGATDTILVHYPFSEGKGTTIYDVSGNGNHGTATNITEASFWANTQDEFHYNLTKGYTENGNVKIPALTDGTADALGNPITNPAGAWHNGAETKLKQHNAPALLQADEPDDFWFDASDIPQSKTYTDIIADVNNGHRTLADVSTTNQKKNICIFNPALVGGDLDDMQEFLNH